MSPSTIVPIIMAGGSGTRLWPVSRDTMPKQFVRLLGSDLSTFQATAKRVSGPAFGKPIVVTNNDFRFVCGEQLAALGIEADIVLEPMRRDSAPAVAVGAGSGAGGASGGRHGWIARRSAHPCRGTRR